MGGCTAEGGQISLSPLTVVRCVKVEVISRETKRVFGFAAKLLQGPITVACDDAFPIAFLVLFFRRRKMQANSEVFKAKNSSAAAPPALVMLWA
jgi:hypothetical protein